MADVNPAADSDNQPEEAVEDISRGCFGYGLILIFLVTLLLGVLTVIIKTFL